MTEKTELTIVQPDENIFRLRAVDGNWWLPSRGNVKGKLMLIFSHPTHEDLETKEILSGAYRLEVQNAIAAAGIDPNEIYVTSMVKRGIGSKPKPTSEQIAE